MLSKEHQQQSSGFAPLCLSTIERLAVPYLCPPCNAQRNWSSLRYKHFATQNFRKLLGALVNGNHLCYSKIVTQNGSGTLVDVHICHKYFQSQVLSSFALNFCRKKGQQAKLPRKLALLRQRFLKPLKTARSHITGTSKGHPQLPCAQVSQLALRQRSSNGRGMVEQVEQRSSIRSSNGRAGRAPAQNGGQSHIQPQLILRTMPRTRNSEI